MSRYEWLEGARIIIVESYFAPLHPKLEFDAKKMVKVMKEANANTIRFGAIGYGALYQSSCFPKHKDLGKRDLLAEVVAECHKEGIKVFTYLPVAHPLITEIYEIHPEWARRSIDNRGIGYGFSDMKRDPIPGWGIKGIPYLFRVCLNGPYREVIHNVVEEICRGYDIDGMYFDGPYFGSGSDNSICYCPTCVKEFRERYKVDLPVVRSVDEVDWDDATFRLYVRWRNEVEEEILGSLSKKIKTLRDIPLVYNRGNYAQRVLKNRIGKQIKHVDGILFEGGRDFLNKLENAQSWRPAGKVIWNYIGDWDIWHRTSFGRLGLKQEGLATLAEGSTPVIAGGNRFFYDQSELKAIKDLFTFMEKNREILSGLQHTKFIALPYSQATVEWYGREDPDGRYNLPFRSFFNILNDAHYPFNIVPEEVLFSDGYLKDYKVLCLSNMACMSDGQADTIKEFVKNGGGLVATYATSLYDENGKMRGDFALSELFGASYLDKSEVMYDTYIRVKGPHPSLEHSSPDKLLPQSEYLIVKPFDDKDVVAETIIGEEPVCPGIIAREFGSGRVVYLPSSLEKFYATEVYRRFYTKIPEFRRVFEDAVRWVCEGQIKCEIVAPNGVSMVLAEKEGICVLHLINYRGDKYERPHCHIESVIPAKDIDVKLRLSESRCVKSAKLITNGNGLNYTQEKGIVEFRIAEVKEYEAVILSLG